MRSYSRPMLLSALGEEGELCSALEAWPLKAGVGGALYSERWLQMLIQRHPTLLTVEQIEPALTPLVPVCVELPLPSAEQFYETLAAIEPGLPARLKGFLVKAEPLGVYPDIRRGLSLKWKSPEDRTFVLGHIDAHGRIATDFAHWSANAIGRVDLSHAYEARLAAAVPGASVRQTPKPVGWRVVLGGQNLPVAKLLEHHDSWLVAISDYVAALQVALEQAQSV